MGVWAKRNDEKSEIQAIKNYLELSKTMYLISSNVNTYTTTEQWYDTVFTLSFTTQFKNGSAVVFSSNLYFGSSRYINIYFRWRIISDLYRKYFPGVSEIVNNNEPNRIKTAFGATLKPSELTNIYNETMFINNSNDKILWLDYR